MRCFNHSDVRAVGICKHCNKALCHDCLTDLDFGLACRGAHEQNVVDVETMVNRAARTQAVNRSNKYLGPIFFLVIGAFFVGYDLLTDNRASSYGLWLGSLFLVYGLYLVAVVRRTYSSAKA